MDSNCVNGINKLKYKLCKKNKKLCERNKTLKNTIKFYESLRRPDLDFLFFLNGEEATIEHVNDKKYTMTIPDAGPTGSNAILFTDTPFHVTADLCGIENFKVIVNATTAEEIEEALGPSGANKLDSYDEPIKSFLEEYETNFPFVDKEPVATITLINPSEGVFNNVSELLAAECKGNTAILTFKVTGNIKRPEEGLYDRASITVSGFSETYIGIESKEPLPSRFLFEINR